MLHQPYAEHFKNLSNVEYTNHLWKLANKFVNIGIETTARLATLGGKAGTPQMAGGWLTGFIFPLEISP